MLELCNQPRSRPARLQIFLYENAASFADLPASRHALHPKRAVLCCWSGGTKRNCATDPFGLEGIPLCEGKPAIISPAPKMSPESVLGVDSSVKTPLFYKIKLSGLSPSMPCWKIEHCFFFKLGISTATKDTPASHRRRKKKPTECESSRKRGRVVFMKVACDWLKEWTEHTAYTQFWV